MTWRSVFFLAWWGLPILLLSAVGCAVDVQDGAGPLVPVPPVPNVDGYILRMGIPVDDLDVELRRQSDAVVVATGQSDIEGWFSFAEVEAGQWEVKIGGDQTGDFDSVSREFILENPDTLIQLADCDIFAYGAEPLSPDPGTTVPAPNLFSPLDFSWTLPTEGLVDWAQVKLYNESGETVWASAKDPVSEVQWNGIGNDGDFDGEMVEPGQYSWRIKIRFADELEARLDPRVLILE